MWRAPPRGGRRAWGEERVRPGGGSSCRRYSLGNPVRGGLGGRLAEGVGDLLAGRTGGSLGGQDAAQEGRRFVQGLLVLEGGVRVGDDAAAGLDVDGAVFDEGGPQRDGGLELAVPLEQADRSRVGAPSV